MALIELRDITRTYQVGGDELKILKGVTLSIEPGEFVAIMGPSGSGKSTLMQIMGLLDRPTGGSYRLLGREVSGLSDDQSAALRSRTIGFIFQMFNLLARTATIDQVTLPMVYAGADHDRHGRARELLSIVGLEERLDHKPSQLSGGQQQRVAIARALANRPRLIFADEPTGNLASDQAEEVLARLKALNAEGITIVMVTHEPDIAAHARRVIRIKDGLVVADERSAPEPQTAAAAAPPPPEEPPNDLGPAQLGEYAASALTALGANKGRSSLSMLGIMIGVAAVITMLAVGQGAQKAIEARLASLGTNMFMIFGGAASTRGVRGAAGSYSRLTLDDAKALKASTPMITDMYPEAEANVSVVYGSQNTVTEMQGVTPDYVSIRNAQPYYGRFFTAEEDQRMERVVVLGQTVVNDLFGTEDPVGRTVEINHQDFKVIGIAPMKGSSGFSDQDNMIFVPIHTAMRRVIGTIYLHEMAFQCATPDAILPAMSILESVLRRRHRLPAWKESDFIMRNMAEMQATLAGTTQTMSLLLGIVAAISLLVGGVGIMNIMLVSVNERTREIGLRKALGATSRAVLLQFLLESALLGGLGGLAGIALGLAVSLGLSRLAGWAAIVTPQSIVIASLFSFATGVVFGLWPASRAAALSPIEALRYE